MQCKIVFEIVAASIAVMILASGVAVGVNTVYTAADGSESQVSLPPPAIYVPDDYSTIQAAVNAASPGDTIIVRDGTYNGNVKVDKRLTLRSENGSDKTIVQAANSEDHIFKVTADRVNISGFTVRGASDDTGIYIYCANNCVISNNTCSNNEYGIKLDGSTNNSISGNTVCNNDRDGIDLWDSSNNTITGNNVSNNNDYGIRLYYSSNNIITGNNASNNNDDGICLSYSYNNSIVKNTCTKNDIGIFLWGSSNNYVTSNNCSVNRNEGLYLKHKSTKNSILDNTCLNNKEGIALESSAYNSISYNTCSHNKNGILIFEASTNNCISNNNCSNNGEGIFIWLSNNNLIYCNNFINNYYNVDSGGSTNVWNSTEEITYTHNGSTYKSYLGNYWDDYEGTDAEGDGIGDTHYSIDSDSDESDDYPLMGSVL